MISCTTMNMKKITALILTLLILMQVLPLGATAAQTEKINDSYESNSIRLLDSLGILKLDEQTGFLWDDTPVKRRELAKIICRLFDFDVYTDTEPLFEDVSSADRPYVETAVRMSYMSGYDAQSFGPEDFVTGEQLIKVFVCVLGGRDVAENFGGFPEGYINIGRRLGIVGKISTPLTENALRIEVADMIYKAIHADMLVLSGINEDGPFYQKEEGVTFLTEELDIYKVSGIITKNEGTSLDDPKGLGDKQVMIDGEVFVDENYMTDGFLGASVVAYVKKPEDVNIGSVVFVEESDKNEILTVDAENFGGIVDKTATYYEKDKSKTIYVSPVADMIYNGRAINFDAEKANIKNGYIRFTDNDGDDKFDVVSVTEWSTGIVDSVNKEEEVIRFKLGDKALSLEESYVRIFKEGVETDISSVSNSDVLLYAVSDGDAKERVVRINISSDYVIGSADEVGTNSDGAYAVVKGVKYKVSDYLTDKIASGKVNELSPAVSGRFLIDANGCIAYFTEAAKDGGVGYLVQASVQNGAFVPVINVMIFTYGGELKTYRIADKVKVNGTRYDLSKFAANDECMSKLQTPQLIKYSDKDGKINEIEFAANQYSATEFSKDASGSILCNPSTVLDEKYSVTTDTIVFCIPTVLSDDENLYNIYNGSYFVYNFTYKAELYDIDAASVVKYAVVQQDMQSGRINDDSRIMLVTNTGESMMEDGDIRQQIVGLDETGNETVIVAKNSDSFMDSTLGREPKAGDVIQYGNDYAGETVTIKIQHEANGDYYQSKTIYSGSGNRTKKVYGEVAYNNSDLAQVYCGTVRSDLVPTDIHKIVFGNATAMYRFDTERNVAERIKFSDLQYGDKIFACVTTANATRILVIYD